MFTLGRDRAYLYGHPEYSLTAAEQARYDDALAQRARGIPAQYITGHQEFWGMDFIVSPAVLIPRPETEHVVETVLACMGRFAAVSSEGLAARKMAGEDARPPQSNSNNESGGTSTPQPKAGSGKSGGSGDSGGTGVSPVRIVDVGTGSGCIALALAKELPQAEIHATDISAAALEIARANAARLQLESRIQFHEGDLLDGMEKNAFDFVVSNPPYVGESEEDSVQLDVRKFEPRNAVFAGPTGLEVIERLVTQANEVLKPGGWLVMEISGTIAARVRDLLAHWGNVQITNDLQGIERVAWAQKI